MWFLVVCNRLRLRFLIFLQKKTAENWFEPVATDYGLVQYNSLQYLIYIGL